jgi:IclR family acetate operon transcriptional repressor
VLSAETGLHPSTAFRILAAATENGLIERNETGHYGFGGQLAGWAACRQGGEDLRALARPVMAWLRDQVEETVNLTEREGDEVVYIERATPQRMMRVEQLIGSRAPLHVTAVGKLMLGSAGQAAVQDYAARTGLTPYTEHTLTRWEDLWRQASQDLAAGYALDNEEAEIGVGCIGVLVRDPAGEPLAGLSISAPIERRRDAWIGAHPGGRAPHHRAHRPAAGRALRPKREWPGPPAMSYLPLLVPPRPTYTPHRSAS